MLNYYQKVSIWIQWYSGQHFHFADAFGFIIMDFVLGWEFPSEIFDVFCLSFIGAMLGPHWYTNILHYQYDLKKYKYLLKIHNILRH